MIGKTVRGFGRLFNQCTSEIRKLYFRTAYDVRFGPNVVVERGVTIRAFDGGSIKIGAGTHIWPNAIIEAKCAQITIGPRSLINTSVFIGASFGISIGADALIAEHVTIRDADHVTNDHRVAFNRQGMDGGKIVIGDSVWLGAKVTVAKCVTIGSLSVVGANSVVTRSLDAGGRYVGAPARLIDANNKFMREIA